MKTDARGVTNVPFEQYDCQIRSLRAPATLAAGTSNGTAVKLPITGPTRIMVVQKVGTIADSGVVAGTIEQSTDGSTGWETIYTFTAGAGSANVQKGYADQTKAYLRHVAVVTGGGAASAITSCDVLY